MRRRGRLPGKRVASQPQLVLSTGGRSIYQIGEADWGRRGLAILVNSTGIVLYDLIADVSIADIDALLNVNVRSTVLASQTAIPHLRAGPITIGSAGAERIAGDTGTVYYMTKSELGSRDITVNLVQPGSTNTDMNPADGDFADFWQRVFLCSMGRR